MTIKTVTYSLMTLAMLTVSACTSDPMMKNDTMMKGDHMMKDGTMMKGDHMAMEKSMPATNK